MGKVALGALYKLDPRSLWKNPVLFLLAIGGVFVLPFSLHASIWMWLTVLFANGAEAFAEMGSPQTSNVSVHSKEMMIGAIWITSAVFLVSATTGCFAEYFSLTIPAAMLAACFLALLPVPIAGLSRIVERGAEAELSRDGIYLPGGFDLEAASDIDIVVIDKEEMIAKVDAYELIPAVHVSREELALAAFRTASSDSTPKGRAIVDFVTRSFPDLVQKGGIGHHVYRMGSQSAIEKMIADTLTHDLESASTMITRQGSKPLVIARDERIVGLVALRESLKPEISSFIEKLRGMAVRPVMLAADGWVAATAAAKQARIEDFHAEVSEEVKHRYIENLQQQGYTVAVVGEGRGELPLSSIYAILIAGRKALLARGALNVFTLASTAVRSLALFPPLIAALFPVLRPLDILHLNSPRRAIISVLIYNALSLLFAAPLLWRGFRLPTLSVRKNLVLYGLGGLALPWTVIKGIALLIGGG